MLAGQFRRVSTKQPVLYVMEDLHWGDLTTIELLQSARGAGGKHARAGLAHFFGRNSRRRGRPLDRDLAHPQSPATQPACRDDRTPCRGKTLPGPYRQSDRRSNGRHSLFIEELTKVVVESGVLAADDHAAHRSAALAIPTTLTASLLARLDRSPQMRGGADRCSRWPRASRTKLISAVAGMPQQELDDALAQLVNAELLFQHGAMPDAEYTFKHALVQDAAYGIVAAPAAPAGPCAYHGHSRETLRRHRNRPAGFCSPHHATEAGLVEKAIGYWLRAGQQAVARSAMQRGHGPAQKGVELLAALPAGPRATGEELDLQVTSARALDRDQGTRLPKSGRSSREKKKKKKKKKTPPPRRRLAEQVDCPEYLVPLLHGQWGYHIVRSS